MQSGTFVIAPTGHGDVQRALPLGKVQMSLELFVWGFLVSVLEFTYTEPALVQISKLLTGIPFPESCREQQQQPVSIQGVLQCRLVADTHLDVSVTNQYDLHFVHDVKTRLTSQRRCKLLIPARGK